MEKEYLGDGCYVERDPVGIKLTTSNGDRDTNTIYMEREVYEGLRRYAEKIGWRES